MCKTKYCKIIDKYNVQIYNKDNTLNKLWIVSINIKKHDVSKDIFENSIFKILLNSRRY